LYVVGKQLAEKGGDNHENYGTKKKHASQTDERSHEDPDREKTSHDG
jgi:hypothetical protein